MSTRHVAARALLAAALLAACGRGENQAADSAAPADSNRLAPPVGSQQPMMDSAVAAGNARIDSLKAAGETPASGIAKGIQPAVRASANDSSADTNRLRARARTP